MNENEFELDGKVYVAVAVGGDVAKCNSCALFKTYDCIKLSNDGEIPYCDHLSTDMIDSVFMEKPQ